MRIMILQFSCHFVIDTTEFFQLPYSMSITPFVAQGRSENWHEQVIVSPKKDPPKKEENIFY